MMMIGLDVRISYTDLLYILLMIIIVSVKRTLVGHRNYYLSSLDVDV